MRVPRVHRSDVNAAECFVPHALGLASRGTDRATGRVLAKPNQTKPPPPFALPEPPPQMPPPKGPLANI